MEKRRWQDWVMLLFGIWLFFSPFIFPYSSLTGMAAWNSYILGVGVAVFAIIAIAVPRMWEEWINLVLGIWLIIAPFVLGFFPETNATWNQIVLGILVAVDAIWAMAQRPMQKVA